MLALCNKCRTTRDIKLKVDNPENLKINRTTIRAGSSVTLQPVCMTCGADALINSFVIQQMVEKRDFVPEKKTRSSKSKCHACQSDQEVKLDREKQPRCMRCGTIVKITKFAIKVKEEQQLFLTAEELAKWKL